MRKRLKRANISAHLEVIDKPTAKAVSLVTHGKLREIYLRHSKTFSYTANRCIVADISAAANYTQFYYDNHFATHIANSQLFYQSAWFLLGKEALDITLRIAHELRSENKTFMFNIGGEYICRNHLNLIEPILPYTNIVVGNADDVKSLAEELKWEETRLEEIALRLSRVGERGKQNYKTVVITHVQ